MKKNKYYLMKTFEGKDYFDEKETEVGKIIDTETGKEVLYILYNKNSYKNDLYRMHTDIRLLDGKEVWVAVIDDTYKDLLYNHNDIFEALALHELGHFINGDLENKYEDKLSVLRANSIKEGKVYDMELKADKFAVSIVGKSRMINAIDYTYKNRLKRENDPIKELALKELDMRKKAIKNMK